ncbi:PP2C family protein-serine/threonine phosphatase [Methylophaga nitratireducenticrescens]|uniref:Protein serine/threonine phosphatase PrpC n=1 Tax=Methylophaga nitratireducenticrescens TaxID=754476 RepID=I1XH15_METNJ|nr:protein phosphatase 2C domain-containing protein [Methylophaga nitratireducenticrescens]AFI83684.1 hypothetical protein Q7A_842 [Methylophaga nitratireducenticrescens]AUZ83811.1 hypothetical protein CDW43_04150 [Methylophaga nitratireducenticrescens]
MYHFYAKSIKGARKSKNDDCFLVNQFLGSTDNYKSQTKKDQFLVGVADGVGGVPLGGFAAKFLMENISNKGKLLSHALILNIINNSHSYLRKEFMGEAQTVFTLAFCNQEIVSIYHVGDTRLYKVTDRNIVQITKDETYTQELIDKGVISDEMKNFHPHKNIIKQSIGGDRDIIMNHYKCTIEPGETLLLSTDGIHDYLFDEDIKNIFKSSKNIQKNINTLIEKSVEMGSNDDITVIAVTNN